MTPAPSVAGMMNWKNNFFVLWIASTHYWTDPLEGSTIRNDPVQLSVNRRQRHLLRPRRMIMESQSLTLHRVDRNELDLFKLPAILQHERIG